jgi:hypothetical protein
VFRSISQRFVNVTRTLVSTTFDYKYRFEGTIRARSFSLDSAGFGIHWIPLDFKKK